MGARAHSHGRWLCQLLGWSGEKKDLASSEAMFVTANKPHKKVHETVHMAISKEADNILGLKD
eukprot:131391-Rhodomonas_salina.2